MPFTRIQFTDKQDTPKFRDSDARFENFDQVLGEVETELEADHFSWAFGRFREAVNLSRGVPALEEAVVNLAVEKATQLLPRSWPIAQSLLVEASEVQTKRTIPRELWSRIEECEREQTINSALIAADAVSSNGMLPPVRQRLRTLLAKYPGEARLESRLKAVEAGKMQLERGWKLQGSEVEIDASADALLLARVTRARAREFEKNGFYIEALDQLKSLRQLDPTPGLEQEIENCIQLAGGTLVEPASALIPKRGRTLELVSKAAPIQRNRLRLPDINRDRLKTIATLAFMALTLVTAGSLIRIHYAKRPPEAVETRPKTHSVPPVAVDIVGVAPSTTVVNVPASPEAALKKPLAAKTLKVKDDVRVAIPASVQTVQSLPPPIVEQPLPSDLVNTEASRAVLELASKVEADKDAWVAVDRTDVHSLTNYLDRFPDGANREAAQLALMNIQKAETTQRSAEVLQVLQRYAAAWSDRNVESILSLQHNLDRRTVKSQLSSLRSLAMNVSPESEPHIEGVRAMVQCRRKVSEVFKDGVEKQGTEQSVTFVLLKRGAEWTIESTTQ